MRPLLALSIFITTAGLALARPRLGRFQMQPHWAALLGAALTVLAGLVPLDLALNTLRLLSLPLLTIAALMAITLVCERAGLLEVLAAGIARRAGGSAHRLFVLVFVAGALTGTLFTNDAAVLLFTPLVVALVDEVALPEWGPAQRLPFFFAVLYVGNLVGALVISNPINLIVTSQFQMRFLDYSAWMVLPSLAAALVSLCGLWLFFRRDLPRRCLERVRHTVVVRDRWFASAATLVLAVTLAGFFAEGWTGVAVWKVAGLGALALLGIQAARGGSVVAVARGIGWDVIVFAASIYLVAMGLRAAGFAELVQRLVEQLGGSSLPRLSLVTATVAAASSSLINNHPTAHIMSWVIQGMDVDSFVEKILVFSALIGGDLGPRMLPIGSLAALIWFRMLRERGIHVSYALYVRVGVPVTLAAIVAAVAVLAAEVALFATPP